MLFPLQSHSLPTGQSYDTPLDIFAERDSKGVTWEMKLLKGGEKEYGVQGTGDATRLRIMHELPACLQRLETDNLDNIVLLRSALPQIADRV